MPLFCACKGQGLPGKMVAAGGIKQPALLPQQSSLVRPYWPATVDGEQTVAIIKPMPCRLSYWLQWTTDIQAVFTEA
eukprot:scaffold128924_cov16-Prasinocladus_malaysianus.AAC.2